MPPPPGCSAALVGEGRPGWRARGRLRRGPTRCLGCSALLVPAKMTGVATPRLLPGPTAPGREVLPWLRKRRPFRKTSSCRVQSGGTGGAKAAGRDENRLGGSWMEARATLFWGGHRSSSETPGSPGTLISSNPSSRLPYPLFWVLPPLTSSTPQGTCISAPPLLASSLPQCPP